jgi:hypothetical protein
MKLKNYSTSVEGEKSIMEVEKLLADFGATAIMKTYGADSQVMSISFKHLNQGYQLPANVEGVNKVLTAGERQRHSRDSQVHKEQQAYRVAWRIIRDWLHSQLSLIASGQAQPDQILLPYLFDGKKTLYEAYKSGQLQIGDGNNL